MATGSKCYLLPVTVGPTACVCECVRARARACACVYTTLLPRDKALKTPDWFGAFSRGQWLTQESPTNEATLELLGGYPG